MEIMELVSVTMLASDESGSRIAFRWGVSFSAMLVSLCLSELLVLHKLFNPFLPSDPSELLQDSLTFELNWEKIRAASYFSSADSCYKSPSRVFRDITRTIWMLDCISFYCCKLRSSLGFRSFAPSSIYCHTGLAGLCTTRRHRWWSLVSATRRFTHHYRGTGNGMVHLYMQLALLSILVQYGSSLLLYYSLPMLRTLVRLNSLIQFRCLPQTRL